MSYLDELQAEKDRIENANNMLSSVVKVWAEFVELNDDDRDLSDRYISDLIADTVGTRLRNIANEIAELEVEDGPNPAKLNKEDLV